MNLENGATLENNASKYNRAFEKKWYIPMLEDFILPYVENHVMTEAEQRVVLYYLWIKYKCNRNNNNKKVLNNDELQIFDSLVKSILEHVDDEVLFDDISMEKLGTSSSCRLFELKKGRPVSLKLSCDSQNCYLLEDQYPYNDFMIVIMQAINERDGKLSFDFMVKNDSKKIKDKEYTIQVCADDTVILPHKTEIYGDVTDFGCAAIRHEQYRIELPIPKSNCDIHFQVKYKDVVVNMPITFNKVASRLTKIPHSYYNFKSVCMKAGNKSIKLTKRNCIRSVVNEIKFTGEILRGNMRSMIKVRIILLRMLHFIDKIIPSKPVWISFDKLYKGGDNGEVFFDYIYHNEPSVKAYYIINKTASEYNDLVKQYGRHVLGFKTFIQRLKVLNADVIFATHMGVFKYCGFDKEFALYLRDLLDAKIYCIQHGLTIQDIPQFQNRLADNTQAYFCASHKETDLLKSPLYGYDEKDLYLTGLARYDRLINEDDHMILIAPTWRRELVIAGNKEGSYREYNPKFKESEYFRIYNSLINNMTLLNCAKNLGYKVVYLLHPTLGMQKKDFSAPEGVQVLSGTSGTSYESMLKRASVMVTDYSGVQFDFAYMRKPVIYFHPDALPPHYDNSGFSYLNDGFGPIKTSVDELVTSLCECMKNSCRIDDEYRERASKFFAHSDHRSCKRICDVAKNL